MVEWMLVRHGKSDWSDSTASDKARPLNNRGRKDAIFLGQKIQERDLVPDRILCSTALRTIQTLQGMMQVLSQYSETRLPEILYFDELYLAAPQTIEQIVAANHGGKGRLMCIGHNPGLESLASRLALDSLVMKTAHLLIFRGKNWDSNASHSETGWELISNLRGEED